MVQENLKRASRSRQCHVILQAKVIHSNSLSVSATSSPPLNILVGQCGKKVGIPELAHANTVKKPTAASQKGVFVAPQPIDANEAPELTPQQQLTKGRNR